MDTLIYPIDFIPRVVYSPFFLCFPPFFFSFFKVEYTHTDDNQITRYFFFLETCQIYFLCEHNNSYDPGIRCIDKQQSRVYINIFIKV